MWQSRTRRTPDVYFFSAIIQRLAPNRAKSPIYADLLCNAYVNSSTCEMPVNDILLPGQPIPHPRGPVPQPGSGVYTRDAQLRASVVGVPRMDGSVGSCVLLLSKSET
jgi:hypothetical protein